MKDCLGGECKTQNCKNLVGGFCGVDLFVKNEIIN